MRLVPLACFALCALALGVVGCGSSDSGTPGPAVDSGVRDTPPPFVQLTLTMPSCGGGGEITREGDATTYVATSKIDVPLGSTVTMNAKADAYSTFAAWTGDCTGTSAACTVTMDAAKAISPTFHPQTGGGAHRVFSSPGLDTMQSLLIDAEGGSIVLGHGAAPMDLGAGIVGTGGAGFAFLARYDADAHLSWAKVLPTPFARARLASNGDVLLVGTFSGAPDFGNGPLTAPSGAFAAFFIARYAHDTGAPISSKAFGTAGSSSVPAVAIDPTDDSIVLAGAYSKGTDLGAGALSPDQGIMVARVSKDGAVAWTHTIAVKNFYYAESLAIDGAGDVLLGGHFEQGTIDLGGGPFSADSTSSSSFLVKYAKADGAHVWSKAYGTGSNNHLYGLAVGPASGLALFADLSGSATFGGPMLTSKGDDFAIVRLASDASFAWQAQLTGPYTEDTRAIAFDAAGDLVLASTYEKDFTIGGAKLPSAGLTDILIARVKGTDGTPTWVRHLGCDGEEDVAAIAIDGDAVRVIGWFAEIDLGDGPVKAQGTADAFLLTLRP